MTFKDIISHSLRLSRGKMEEKRGRKRCFFRSCFLDKRDEIWYYILSWYWLFYLDGEETGGTPCSESRSVTSARRNTKRSPLMRAIRLFLQMKTRRKKIMRRKKAPGTARLNTTNTMRTVTPGRSRAGARTTRSMRRSRRKNRNRGASSVRKPGSRTLSSAYC